MSRGLEHAQGRSRFAAIAVAAALAFLAGSGSAAASSPLSEGAALFVGASPDATHVYFFSVDRLDPADDDATKDLYESVGGRQRLIAAGPGEPSGATDASLRAISGNGRHVFFQTKERLLPDDTDSAVDTYERTADELTQISTASQNANGPGAARYQASSNDGSKVVFSSPDQLVPQDNDSALDLYLNEGGDSRLLTPGTAQPLVALGRSDRGTFGVPRTLAALDGDGGTLLFATAESLLPADSDTQIDIYSRSTSGGPTTLVSTGPADDGTCPGADCDAERECFSTDGSRVVFDTREKLVPEDTDGANDLYARSGATTELISVGDGGRNTSFPGFLAATPDCTKVLFGSSARLTSDDPDPYGDIFERAGGDTILRSGGLFDHSFFVTHGGGVDFNGASTDLGRVVFTTYEQLVRADRFDDLDIYSNSNGRSTVVSGSPLDRNDGNSDVEFGGISANGRAVYFSTRERLVGADRGENLDIYGRFGPKLFLASRGTGRRHGGTLTLAVSRDGRRLIFTSAVPLVKADHDKVRDIYERRRGRRTILLSG
jgi:hypothetical protein